MIILTISLYAIQLQCQAIMCQAPISEMVVEVSAYNSCPWQCSGDPFVTAYGYKLTDDSKVVASNFLKDNQLVSINGVLYANKDKMAARYNNHIDIYMGSCSDENVKKAINFGRQKIKVIIYE